MNIRRIEAAFPVVSEICDTYRLYRERGDNREKAVKQLHHDYMRELEDRDDRSGVLLGIALALCQKNELTETVLNAVEEAVAEAYANEDMMPVWPVLKDTIAFIRDPRLLGDEAKYRGRKKYTPEWEVGDTFAHILTCPLAKDVGIEGWFILLRKVEEYVDNEGSHRQLMYVTLCQQNQLPQTMEELQKLGFLRMMCRGDKWDYLAQITFTSQRDEAFYGLTKIGTFANAGHPRDRTIENPLVTMPLFGRINRKSTYPDYEDTICRLYRKYGKYLPSVPQS